MQNYLFDKDFLKELDYNREKQTYVRITSLTNDDFPREEVIGRATGGSVNLDGTSAVRRSCSLSLVTFDNDKIITDNYWCYNNKFKLEIGLKNLINNEYPEIIWFEMGVYVITSFNKNKNLTNTSISISGKDKMCRLNGEVSGNIMNSTDFGAIEEVLKIEEIDEKTGEKTLTDHTTITKLPLYMIIQNALKQFGQERAENIIINDLDEHGYELWEYRGDFPMYLFIDPEYNSGQGIVLNMTFNGETLVKTVEGEEQWFFIKDLEKNGGQYFSMNTLDSDYNINSTEFIYGNGTCRIAKIEYGETAGYHRTPLVYNGDLILNAGETVTSLLDKIKNMLGEFEYFYDLKGRFIFQKKNDYMKELFSPIDGEVVMPSLHSSPYEYRFEDTQLFSAMSNSPNINNLKNDFAIWGSRKTSNGDIPIHARYAVDKKPIKYCLPYDRYELIEDLWYVKFNEVEVSNKEQFNQYTDIYIKENDDKFIRLDDYKEIEAEEKYYSITKRLNYENKYELYKQNLDLSWQPYQPEQDLYKKTENGDFTLIDTSSDKAPYYKKIEAKTLYSSLDYDWRELIYQMALDFYQHNQEADFLIEVEKANPWFVDGKTGYEQYYLDLQGFWRQLYNPNPTVENQKIYGEFYTSNDDDKYWNKKIHLAPDNLIFWFDFLDTEGELGNYSIKKYDKEKDRYITKIGVRSKVVNENSVNSIYFRDTPEVLFIVSPKETLIEDDRMAYIPIWIQDSMEGLFYRSAQGISAINKANELIYQHTATIEGITLTSIPIYYLQPNSRIYVKGHGDYSLNKITYSLTYNGTMSLSGNKIIKQFY